MSITAPSRPLTVTVDQAARLLGISRTSAYELVHTGEIYALRLGRRLVVPVAWLAEQLGLEPSDIWAFLESDRSESESLPPREGRPTATRRTRSSHQVGGQMQLLDKI